MTGPPASIPNPQLPDLQDALSKSKGLEGFANTRLDGVKSNFLAGAWSGTPESDAFFGELGTNITALKTAGQGCVDNVQARINATPATVPNPATEMTPQ